MTHLHDEYEAQDRGSIALLLIAVATVVLLAVTLIGVGYVLNGNERSVAAPGRKTKRPVPAVIDPTITAADLRQSQEKQISKYGWIDRENGIVRIPIERAIELVADDGLPVGFRFQEDDRPDFELNLGDADD